MNNAGRPLSPHLSIYRWPVTMVLSICHRASGVAMSVGLLAYAAWLMAASGEANSYDKVTAVLGSLPGRILLIAWSAAFFLHLANGIRHLAWDLGFGFEPGRANATGWSAVAIAALLTLLFWWLV